MPEIAEVHRTVHFIRQHLVGKRIALVKAQHDENVFGKVGTSAAEFERAMKDKTIVGAGQQGKYFWLEMSSPPHPVLHFGMTGWFHIRNQQTYYYKSGPSESSEWPPKYWKFNITTQAVKGEDATEAAYVDARRFGRVRLVDCPASELRKTTPLKENGPDPVIDKDLFTREFLAEVCERKRIPIKALLLDQANISGIGNWVGDEVLFHARIHPEQYANTLKPAQITQLHSSIIEICTTACDLLADSSQFPEGWLFKHRWGKGKKDSPSRLPSGEKIVFVTVGGRTSAVVPSIQKKTGPVAGDVKTEERSDSETDEKVNTKEEPKRKREVANAGKKRSSTHDATNKAAENAGTAPKKARTSKIKAEQIPEKEAATPATKVKEAAVNGTKKTVAAGKAAREAAGKRAKGQNGTGKTAIKDTKVNMVEAGRRRSGRLSRS